MTDSEVVRQLNDLFRTRFVGGQVTLTAGVNALPSEIKAEALRRVRCFEEFTKDNDPYGEYDFGSFDFCEEKFFWKIDTYDKAMRYGSPDPADPAVTTRVLTLMLAHEY